MKLSDALRAELSAAPKGTRCPEVFRAEGYRAHFGEPVALLRARGIETLFTKTPPHIYPSDRIAGSTAGLFCEPDETLRKASERLCAQIGGRSFITNRDHFAPDYDRILARGIPGLLADIDASLDAHREDAAACETLDAMRIALAAFRTMTEHYAEAADGLRGQPGYDAARLAFIAANCRAVAQHAPESFAEGLQLVWLCHTAFMLEDRYAMALGRLDQYLYPLYARDRASGAVTREDAVELLENVFAKIPTTDVVNICVGGKNAAGVCEVNELSFCIVEAVKNCNAPGPNLSARITRDTPDEFLDACLASIGTGLGYPALMNDEVNIPALQRMGYAYEDVCGYCMVGCIENFLPGLQPPWSDGRFDAPRFFDYIFNRGVSAFNGSVGLDTGDPEALRDMPAFLRAFETQLSHGVAEYCTAFECRNNAIRQDFYTEPFLSCFCRDCIRRGKDINCGGSVYPSVHGAALMGVGTVADSLAAIERVVYEDHAATLSELRDALNADFEGYDALRERLLAAPKYGNNDDFVDKYAVWYLDFLSAEFDRFRTRDGGRIYVAMAANTSNIWAGQTISATPDGRKRGKPLSDAASPTYGRDTRGATVTLNSVSKPDYTKAACGTVVNQKFSPSMFEGERRDKLRALVRTYFRRGGQEIQMNATSRAVLADAMEHPEQYPTLVVRVSGFSDYFVRLPRAVQLDILNRTQHE